MSLVYDVDGARGKFGRVQTVVLNDNKEYYYVRLKYNTNFNFSIGGEVTLDDISLLAGDYVYLDGQNIPSENGIYEVQVGAWTLVTGVDDDIFVDLGARSIDTVDGDLTRDIITYKPDLDFGKVGFYTIRYYVVNSIGILSGEYRKVKVISDAKSSISQTDAFKITHYEVIAGADADFGHLVHRVRHWRGFDL